MDPSVHQGLIQKARLGRGLGWGRGLSRPRRRDAEGVERVGNGEEVSLPNRLWGMGSVVKFYSGCRGGAPAKNEFQCFSPNASRWEFVVNWRHVRRWKTIAFDRLGRTIIAPSTPWIRPCCQLHTPPLSFHPLCSSPASLSSEGSFPFLALRWNFPRFWQKEGKERKVLRFNVQFKSWLNQLSVSHESNKKAENPYCICIVLLFHTNIILSHQPCHITRLMWWFST